MPYATTLQRTTLLAILAFSANLKYTIDNCGVHKTKAVQVLAQLTGDGAMEVNNACTTSGVRADAHVYYETWPVVINALIHCFVTEHVLQEAHCLVFRAAKWQGNDDLKLRTKCSKLQYRIVAFLQLSRNVITTFVS